MIRQIVQANAILLIQYSVGSLVPLLLVPHIVSVIGLTEYGHLAVLMAWGGYGAVVVQYAFHMTGPKRIAQLGVNESSASVFVDITFAKFLLLLIVFSGIVLLTRFIIPFKSTSQFASIMLFAIPLSAGLNSSWFLQTQGIFLPVCIFSIIGSIITLIIGFNYINSSNHQAIEFAILVTIIGQLFTGFGTMLFAFFLIKEKKYEWNIRRAVNVLKEGWFLFVSQFFSMLYTATGPIVINYLVNAKSAGSYSVTERVVSAVMLAALLTHTAAYPRLASLYKSSRTAYRRMLRFILSVYLSITFIIAVLTWSLRQFVVQFLYGEVSNDHDKLLFFGLVYLVMGIFGPALTGYLTVSGRSYKVLSINIKILILTITLAVPAVLHYAEAGWMAAFALGQILNLITGIYYWRKENWKMNN